MNQTASHLPTPALGEDGEFCAVLVLDALGAIVAANQSARELWSQTQKSLVTAHFIDLLAAHAADDPDHSNSWQEIKAAALDRAITLKARLAGLEPRALRIRIERALGGAGTYIATIRLA